ncbi:MAG TPA: hypothetical protein DCZ72_02190 [Armatimonadetes bacterium]|nr:hypothetical protein [Armatimonadota bacterium]
MKFAACNEMFGETPFEETCETLAQLGYQGVEVAPFTLADDVRTIDAAERARLRGIAEGAGLEVVGLHWLLIKPEGLHLTTPDDALRQRTTEYMLALVDFCADLGGSIMVCGSPKQRTVLDSYEAAWARAVEVFRAMGERGAARGVTVCIEPLAPTETEFLQTAAEVESMLADIDHPNCALILDVKAMDGGEGRPPHEVVLDHAKHLRHVHVNDPNLLGPGMGDFDHAAMGRALRQLDYQGYVSVEVFRFEQSGAEIAAASLDGLRRWYGEA